IGDRINGDLSFSDEDRIDLHRLDTFIFRLLDLPARRRRAGTGQNDSASLRRDEVEIAAADPDLTGTAKVLRQADRYPGSAGDKLHVSRRFADPAQMLIRQRIDDDDPVPIAFCGLKRGRNGITAG